MDKILSARVDEAVIHRLGTLAKKLGKTKKSILEDAICLYAEKVEKEQKIDILEQTLGAWHRSESPDETVETARQAFRRSVRRHHP